MKTLLYKNVLKCVNRTMILKNEFNTVYTLRYTFWVCYIGPRFAREGQINIFFNTLFLIT